MFCRIRRRSLQVPAICYQIDSLWFSSLLIIRWEPLSGPWSFRSWWRAHAEVSAGPRHHIPVVRKGACSVTPRPQPVCPMISQPHAGDVVSLNPFLLESLEDFRRLSHSFKVLFPTPDLRPLQPFGHQLQKSCLEVPYVLGERPRAIFLLLEYKTECVC